MVAAQAALAVVPQTPEIRGRVIEAGTGRGIPDAVVVAAVVGIDTSWWPINLGHGGSGHYELRCLAVRVGMDGRFRVPPWKGGESLSIGNFGVNLIAYHRDYAFQSPRGLASVHQPVSQIPLIGTPLAIDSEAVVPMRRFDRAEGANRWGSKLGLPIEWLKCANRDKASQDLLWEAMHEEVAEYSRVETPHPAGSTMNKLEDATGRPSTRPPPKVIGGSAQSTIAAPIAAVVPSAVASSVRIARVSPDPAKTLRVGDRVQLVVDVAYTVSADLPVMLIVQAADHAVIANITETAKSGTGTVTLKSEFVVPETDAIEIFTPIRTRGARMPQGDTRHFAVAPRK
jgi:hypothetical protein